MLKDMANLYNISCEHLSRLFKKKLGLTFKEYLYSVRLTHACRLLAHTEKSILDISMEAGFPDMRAFSQQFDRVYHTNAQGIPPKISPHELTLYGLGDGPLSPIQSMTRGIQLMSRLLYLSYTFSPHIAFQLSTD